MQQPLLRTQSLRLQSRLSLRMSLWFLPRLATLCLALQKRLLPLRVILAHPKMRNPVLPRLSGTEHARNGIAKRQ